MVRMALADAVVVVVLVMSVSAHLDSDPAEVAERSRYCRHDD